MKHFISSIIAGALFVLVHPVLAGPPLVNFSTIKPDAVGQRLEASMIWNGAEIKDLSGVAVAFRKKITFAAPPVHATLHLFADARYLLWVNGKYVERGPARFQPNGPEYDSVNLDSKLQAGENVLALLVVGNLSGGKVMRHAPGLTAVLETDGQEVARTDASWKWSDKTRFRKVTASWANLGDAEIDARVEDGDWTQVNYADAGWQPAITTGSQAWGHLTARRIPRLREKSVPYTFAGGVKLPVTLHAGQKLEFDAGRMVQAYPVLELSADDGAEITLEPFRVKYFAKAGAQSHFTIDSCGVMRGAIVVAKGNVTVTGFKLMERLYPYDRLGLFQSSDAFLNQLWEMCARSCEVLSEDSYVDCADRERVEWMDDTPPGFDITRTVMAGPAGADGKPVFSDPRLLGELVRRTALTLQPEGWVKAHTCSDRYDIHAKMEDRACDWVTGIRLYYEATGDADRVREIWPAVVAQMNYFLQRRTERGLVSARDWVVWGNPLGYITGQTTTLNAFVYRALADSAFLAGVIGEKSDATRFSNAADELAKNINTVLWDEKNGGYYSGYFSETDLAATRASQRGVLKLPLTNGLTPSTLHANVFALDQGVVPPARRDQVIATMLNQIGPKKEVGSGIMTAYYIFKQLYALDQPRYDNLILSQLRERWQPMVASPLECSWEGYGGGSKAHIYGMYPGYFLSAYVLGVRRDAPVVERKLLIEPHLGDLTQATGVVVTEFGVVPVTWETTGQELKLTLTVPLETKTTLALPYRADYEQIRLDGQMIKGTRHGNRLEIPLTAGAHKAVY